MLGKLRGGKMNSYEMSLGGLTCRRRGSEGEAKNSRDGKVGEKGVEVKRKGKRMKGKERGLKGGQEVNRKMEGNYREGSGLKMKGKRFKRKENRIKGKEKD